MIESMLVNFSQHSRNMILTHDSMILYLPWKKLPEVTIVLFLSRNCSQMIRGSFTEKYAIHFMDYKLKTLQQLKAFY